MGVQDVLVQKFLPSGVDINQWLGGKPSRADTFAYVGVIQEQLTEMNDFLKGTMGNVGGRTNQIMAAMRLMNHQIDTLLRIGSGGKHEDRQKYFGELRKTIAFAEFIDSLMANAGQHFNKTIREKLELLRGWNTLPDVVRCDFDGLQLQRYIQENPKEFTLDEIVLLEKEFNFEADKTILDQIEVGEELNVSPTATRPTPGEAEGSDVSGQAAPEPEHSDSI
jgi:hypothetical protein